MARNRRPMVDITNTIVSPRSNEIKKCKDVKFEALCEEIRLLKQAITKKDATIESQTLEIQQLRIRNREFARNNSQLFREHALALEKATILQHECNQRSSMFEVLKAELEQKVGALSSQLKALLTCSDKIIVPAVDTELSSPRESSQLSTSTDRLPSGKRNCLRPRSGNVNYKEPSLTRKLRRPNAETSTVLPENSSRRARRSCSSKTLRTIVEACEDCIVTEDYGNATTLCGDDVDKGGVLDIEPLQVSLDELKLNIEPQTLALTDFEEATGHSVAYTTRRSTRKAASAVSSYKEYAVNCKMRREA